MLQRLEFPVTMNHKLSLPTPDGVRLIMFDLDVIQVDIPALLGMSVLD